MTSTTNKSINSITKNYIDKLYNSFDQQLINNIEKLAFALLDAWKKNKRVFICGNGGSAANAIHIANDILYGVGALCPEEKTGICIESLASNQSIITCLANDIGYENIFSYQLETKGSPRDLLIVLSGSGNSKNIINALYKAKEKNMETFAIVGFDGGLCKKVADIAIHLNENDMELAEDSQMIIFNICKKWLAQNNLN